MFDLYTPLISGVDVVLKDASHYGDPLWMHAPLKKPQTLAITTKFLSLCSAIGVVELSLFDWFLFSLSPGLCPDWEDWNPKNAKKNAKEAMDNAEKWLDIPQV